MAGNIQLTTSQVSDLTHGRLQTLGALNQLAPDILECIFSALSVVKDPGRYPFSSFMANQNLKSGSAFKTVNEALKGSNFREINGMEYQWCVYGNYRKPIRITDTLSFETGAGNPVFPGINNSEFTLSLQEKYFSRGDVCRFEDDSQARVMQEPYRNGSSWCYTFKLVKQDPYAYVSPEACLPGRLITCLYNAHGEMSIGGGLKGATATWFKNTLSTMRKMYSISGHAASTKMLYDLKIDGESFKYLGDVQEYAAMTEFYEEREMALWFSKYNRSNNDVTSLIDENGLPVVMFSGLEELCEYGGLYEIADITESFLNQFVYDIIGRESQEKVVFTGQGGMRLFDEAMRRATRNDSTNYQVNDKMVSGDKNNLVRGLTFREYNFMGNKIRFCHHPLFDNKNYFPEVDAYWGHTLKSYEMYVLDFRTFDGGAKNIEILTRKNRALVIGLEQGMASPKGETKLMVSSGVDAYTHHMLSDIGLVVRDPSLLSRIKVTRPRLV